MNINERNKKNKKIYLKYEKHFILILFSFLKCIISIYEYLMAVVSKDADQLKKCNSRLIKRLILMAILFLLPSLINLLLKLVGDNYGVCLNTK